MSDGVATTRADDSRLNEGLMTVLPSPTLAAGRRLILHPTVVGDPLEQEGR